jgi:glycosyltransferase involved in cell wall biosynthesis
MRSTPAQVVVFVQNRLLIGECDYTAYAPRTAARLMAERFVARAFRVRVHRYFVQTPSMARELEQWWRPSRRGNAMPAVEIVPFAAMKSMPDEGEVRNAYAEWDFVYVADGLAHKNHRRLFESWSLLAAQGLRPTLALTLSARDLALKREVQRLRTQEALQIVDLGELPQTRVMALYRSARALIFPSLSESFGLPLIEAKHCGIPIIASERDFVRDVCRPVQTFDPLSPVSIARAVCRFLGEDDAPVVRVEPAMFWRELLTDSSVKS